jgi:H+-transporting ATPase
VSTATDVAKSAAGLVLTEPGLGGIVAAVKEGRATFQRILTYTLNALLKKIEMVLFLGAGLLMTGHAVLTPILMALLLVTNDFLTMSLTTDRARPSPRPDVWRIGPITGAAVALGLVKLAFSTAVLAVGRFGLGLAIGPLRTLAFFTMVVDAQATVYAIRERRRLWSSRPGGWVLASSAADLGVGALVALNGWLTPSLPARVVMGLIAVAVPFALLLDAVKGPVFRRLGIA